MSATGLPVESLLFVALIIVLAYTVFGLTGFGSSITAMPLLVQFLPLRTAVPVMLLLDLVTGVLLISRHHQSVQRKEIFRLLPFMLVGMVLGVTLLVSAPERPLLLVLGAFVLCYAGWSLLVKPPSKQIAVGWSAPIGSVGGVFTALFGTGGPVYAIYLARRIDDKAMLRSTQALLILISALVRLVLFSVTGLTTRSEVLMLALAMLPFSLLGLWGGSHLHIRLAPKRVIQATWVVLIGGGISLLLRNA